MVRRGAIEGPGQRLAGDSGQMHRPPAEIDDLLRMALGPAGVGASLGVAGVGGRGGIATLHRRHQAGIADRPGEPAVADALEAAIPAGAGQPDLKADARVGGWMQHALDPAEGGKLDRPGGPQLRRDGEGPCRLQRR